MGGVGGGKENPNKGKPSLKSRFINPSPLPLTAEMGGIPNPKLKEQNKPKKKGTQAGKSKAFGHPLRR